MPRFSVTSAATAWHDHRVSRRSRPSQRLIPVLCLLALAACGRVGFRLGAQHEDDLDGGSPPQPDAAVPMPDAAVPYMDAGLDAGLDASRPQDAALDGSSPRPDASPPDGSMPIADAAPDAMLDADTGPPPPPTPATPPTRGNLGSLIHRYSFNGPTTACVYDNPLLTITPSECARDSVGGAHGIIHNAAMHDGVVEFTGAGWVAGSNQPPANPEYVELPSHMFSTLDDMTLIVWFYWSGQEGGTRHQPRVFNFGSDDGNNGLISYFYLTPNRDGNNGPRMALDTQSHALVTADAPARPAGNYCYGIVFDNSRIRVTLYVGGFFSVVNDLAGDWLGGLDDEKNWLGRSPVAMDTPFVGTIDELRVYDAALDTDDIDFICGEPD